jgi:hypothetical protein
MLAKAHFQNLISFGNGPFVTAIKMLAAKGHVRLGKHFADGTKIKSAFGRYTFVMEESGREERIPTGKIKKTEERTENDTEGFSSEKEE